MNGHRRMVDVHRPLPYIYYYYHHSHHFYHFLPFLPLDRTIRTIGTTNGTTYFTIRTIFTIDHHFYHQPFLPPTSPLYYDQTYTLTLSTNNKENQRGGHPISDLSPLDKIFFRCAFSRRDTLQQQLPGPKE